MRIPKAFAERRKKERGRGEKKERKIQDYVAVRDFDSEEKRMKECKGIIIQNLLRPR